MHNNSNSKLTVWVAPLDRPRLVCEPHGTFLAAEMQATRTPLQIWLVSWDLIRAHTERTGNYLDPMSAHVLGDRFRHWYVNIGWQADMAGRQIVVEIPANALRRT